MCTAEIGKMSGASTVFKMAVDPGSRAFEKLVGKDNPIAKVQAAVRGIALDPAGLAGTESGLGGSFQEKADVLKLGAGKRKEEKLYDRDMATYQSAVDRNSQSSYLAQQDSRTILGR